MNPKRSIKAKIIAHLGGDLNEEGLKELTSWVSQSRGNTRYYAKIKDLWEVSRSGASQIAETEKEWFRLLVKMREDHRSNMFMFSTNWQIMSRFAAILIIGVLFGVLASKFISSRGSVPGYITFIAPQGSVSQIVMDDGTLVCLNAGSEIKYPRGNKGRKREVFLTGEAWFHVEKNKTKPFVVHTTCYDVLVTGTQFNVKSYPSDPEVTTTLEEGQVEICSSGSFKLAGNIMLRPGEQAVLCKETSEMLVRDVDTDLYTSWRDNKLIFLKMNLKELIVLLERKYGVNIEVRDDDILAFHYTGTIKNESILDILEIIQHTLPITYCIEKQRIIINKR